MVKIVELRPQQPKSATAAFNEIKKVLQMGWVPIPDKKSYRGHGAPGRILEDLLQIAENNADSPDLNDWEVKFHGGNALLTLFHKDPEPRGIIRFLVHEHGWKDDKGRISFRHTLGGQSNRGFYVVNEADRIIIRHNTKDTVVPYWKHNTLLNAIGGKLRRLIVVDGVVEKHPTPQVKFNSATAYWDFNLIGFCKALEDGKVFVDFDARTQAGEGSALRNHGTKFRIKVGDIAALYEHSKKLT